MRPHGDARLPPAQRRAMRYAWKLEAIWFVLLCTIVVAIYLSAGNSQAMKVALFEDFLSFVPSVAFMIATRIERWPPNERFPAGFVRVTTIGYLVSAVALAGVGLFLIVDSALTLIQTEHPTIGSIELFGVTLWFGWLMLAALLYSVVLPVIFGRLKMRPARELHDKILWADALMNKADWMTGAAAAVGVIGIGFGLWWADAVAAILIALDVLHDGYAHTRAAISDLTDEVPRTVDDAELDPLPGQLKAHVDALPWVRDSRVQFREEGRFLSGAIIVVPTEPRVDPEWVRAAETDLFNVHWRVYDVAIMPRPDL